MIGPLPSTLAKYRLVERDGHGRPSAATYDEVQRGREPAEVVGMAVAEEDGLDLAQISPEVGDVVAQDVAAQAAVEQRRRRPGAGGDLDEEGEAVGAQRSGGPPGLEHVAQAPHRAPALLGACREVPGERREADGVDGRQRRGRGAGGHALPPHARAAPR